MCRSSIGSIIIDSDVEDSGANQHEGASIVREQDNNMGEAASFALSRPLILFNTDAPGDSRRASNWLAS